MSRKAREKSPTGVYHVLVTGVEGQNLFLDEEDLRKYIALLEEYQTVCAFDLYAYCLMENHIHLLLCERDGDISRIMKRLGTSYVYWFNNRHERMGRLFEDRFKSAAVIDEDGFAEAVRFIHNDPVRSIVCEQPEDYQFSSYRDYFENKMIQTDMAKRVFGGAREFVAFHAGKSAVKCLDMARKDKVLTDEALKTLITKEYQIPAEELVFLPKERIAKIAVQLLKSYHISVRQLGRVTGISMSTVWRLITKSEAGGQEKRGET